ncbi:S9 family peptidase [Longitalea luteola]|uniref:S9 family peptidase n=1 Tax=Longitalea luteola TaxID=2812563 RepID=UPI001A95ACD0|nr:S9 family peptidase [Longitalea luteola]
MTRLLLLLALFSSTIVQAQKGASVSFEKWLSLQRIGDPVISPDGRTIVYPVTTTDWANNTYDSELWMSRDGETPVQLTRTAKGSSFSPRFTPDSRFVSFLADRGDKSQLYIIAVAGGEALQVTKEEDGIVSYGWNHAGTQLALIKTEPDSKPEKTLKDRYGAFGVEGEDYRHRHLWLLDFNYDSVILAGQLPCYDTKKDSAKKDSVALRSSLCLTLPAAKRLTSGSFTVINYAWSPDDRQILITKQRDPLILSGITSDIALLTIATKKIDTLVSNPTSDFNGRWSPDGRAFIYQSAVNDSVSDYYKNNRLFIYDMATKTSREIATDIDEYRSIVDWNKYGLFVGALERTRQKLFTVDPKTGKTKAVDLPYDLTMSVAFSRNTDKIAVIARNYNEMSDCYTGSFKQPLKKITNFTGQLAGWKTPVNEIIRWKSKDGVSIEGVLSKPAAYDPQKKYPLLVVIHGGPTGIDIPDPTAAYVYPLIQWVEKGALVLRVNYRGSAGYGEKFRSLNVRNLGVGDMWDVVSGVEYLNSKGMIDTSRMGAMGWSQGGYISAFLTTNTHIFKAISVGAGISNWVTYYVNSDITPFTRQYLQNTPWNDMDIYLKTSPMTNINQATTPTLIQHGEFDKRVPIPNAYELYRGLQDRKVPSRLIVYKGFGHSINKPKERLAAVWHNWLWFNNYVFGEKEESIPVE